MRRALAAVFVVASLVACGSFSASEVSGGSADDAAADAFGTTDALVDGGGAGAGDACPSGRGPAMVLVTSSNSRFCIDETEVTRAQYKTFLDTGSSSHPWLEDQPATCAWNKSFQPGNNVDFGRPDLPMVTVNWCQAFAFCAWAGKRLCGDVADGGPLALTAAGDLAHSEWMVACTKNGSRTLPGGGADASACNIQNEAGAAPAGTYSGCEGGYDGVFDMVGNVTEWENACEGLAADGGGHCADRGGSFRAGGACSFVSKDRQSAFASDWGIRCCANAR